MLDFARGQPDVDRDHDSAQRERRIGKLDDLEAVGQIDQDAVTRAHAEPGQPCGDAADRCVQLGVCYALIAADHGQMRRSAQRVTGENVLEPHAAYASSNAG